MPALNKRNALAAIDTLGICLVFPHDNRPEPASLWSHFFPRTRMRWEWDAGGDDRVPTLWHLRTELATSGRAVYTKWWQGRATFLSLPVFSGLVRMLAVDEELGLSETARVLLRCYEEQSPLSTKEVKRAAELEGRTHARDFEAGMKELWSRLLVVGAGEKEEGSYPSLLVGASKWMHESAFRTGLAMPEEDALAVIDRYLPAGTPFRRWFDRQRTRQPRQRRMS